MADVTGRIAMLEIRTEGSATDDNGTDQSLTRFIYSNHLQSSNLELNESGGIISYEEYHPYGTTAYQSKSSTIAATAKRYRYTGKERDEESGLSYHGARYFAPWLCRWTAVDPLESKYAGWSSYNYGFNNPIKWTDPTGMGPDKYSNTTPVPTNDNTSVQSATPTYNLYNSPDGGILQLPVSATIESTFSGGDASSSGVTIHPMEGSVWNFSYKGETYDAQFDDKGQFSGYQSETNSSHRVGYGENTTPKIDPNTSKNRNYAMAGVMATGIFTEGNVPNPYVKGAAVAGGVLLTGYFLYHAATSGISADLPINITRPIALPQSIPKDSVLAVPTDIAIPKPPPVRVALSITEHLLPFSVQTEALPFAQWPGGQPFESTPAAYAAAIIGMGTTIPNISFHMNVSTKNGGYIFDPANAASRSSSVTFAEFMTVYTAFKDKTTFYEKSGSIFKPIKNIDQLLTKRGFK